MNNQLQHQANKLLIEAGYLCQQCHMVTEPRYKDDGTVLMFCERCLHNRRITSKARKHDYKPGETNEDACD